MAKKIAILSYEMIFDPSETWSNGYQFEKLFGDFFAYYGFEAQIVEAAGGSGKRVIYIERKNSVQQVAKQVPQPKDPKPAVEQIKQVQTRTPQTNFKTYQDRGVPKSFVNQDKRAPQLQFNNSGRSNRLKLRSQNG